MYPHTASLLILSLACLPVMAENRTTLNDETDRINYAIGHQIGSDFRKQQVDLDRKAVTQGMQQGYQGDRPALAKSEMSRRLLELKRSITDDTKAKALAQLQKRQAEMKHKRAQGEDFLAANADKPGIIATDSGLQYRVIRTGKGAYPKLSDRVRLHYKSSRINGQVINSSELKGGPGVFPVNLLLPGVTEAIKMMQPGAKWELYLPSKLAFGRRGPFAHEVIIANVELLEILPKAEDQTESVDASNKQGNANEN